jgi:ABC-type antimicrobial peptide transport system permease subunit
MSASFAQRRFMLIVLGVFAGAALLLAAIGLYGVLAYAVSERVREIGIRMALGASRGQVLTLVLGQGMRLVGLGVGIGSLGALGLNRGLVGMLYEVKPGDPSVFAVMSLVLLLVALLASWLPARRAARVDPMVALRSE